jgi:nitronate monooxygenase
MSANPPRPTAETVRAMARRLAFPAIAAPMFLVSRPELVIAQCLGGIIGSFPALNARPSEEFELWLEQIEEALLAARAADPARLIAPYAVNQIVHRSNERLERDMEICVRHRVPIIITSLSAPDRVVAAAHAYGGLVFHDVANAKHARRALDAGVDGLILVSAGAGGHGGALNPFAFVAEVRRFYDGPLILSGGITNGGAVLAAEAAGADFAYIGTRFIATEEANASAAYKEMIVAASASDIVSTPFFSGVMGNYLKASIAAQGLDPDALPVNEGGTMSYASNRVRPWKDIWSAGHGVGAISDCPPAAEVIARLRQEYAEAKARICAPLTSSGT